MSFPEDRKRIDDVRIRVLSVDKNNPQVQDADYDFTLLNPDDSIRKYVFKRGSRDNVYVNPDELDVTPR